MTALQTMTAPAARPGPMADRLDPEVPAPARLRTFTARYKLAVLTEYDAAEPGARGAILRRKGGTPRTWSIGAGPGTRWLR